MNIIRKKTSKCFIGQAIIGGESHISIQSMTNTATRDVERTINQCQQLFYEGADFVRITVPSLSDIPHIKEITKILKTKGIDQPIIADVHFKPDVAEALTSIVDKIRINPGNYIDKRNKFSPETSDFYLNKAIENTAMRAKSLLTKCKENGTAIRIGTNHGSLSDRIVAQYGNTPLAMAASAMEWIDICESFDFKNIVLSLKASNVRFMMDSYILLSEMMEAKGTFYPLHIGVTEAGGGLEGRAKSAAGIGALLLNGLGDTIRVSLTEDPIHEIRFARKLLNILNELSSECYYIDENRILHFSLNEPDTEKFIAGVASICSFEHYKEPIRDLHLENIHLSENEIKNIEQIVLQAVEIKFYYAEFISCPSCGRTEFNIEEVAKRVKEQFSSYKGLKIGIMGCIVNGPGEMADANYGVVGAGKDRLVVYKGKSPVSKSLPISEALECLEELIEKDSNNC